MGVLRWLFKKHPRQPYKKPNYTPYQKRQTLKKYPKNPGPDYKVSRVNVPKSRQDSLFSAFLNWIFRTGYNNRKGGSGGRS